MSIHVTDFKWEKGKNDLQYIELLEKTLKNEQAITAKAITKIRNLSKESSEHKQDIYEKAYFEGQDKGYSTGYFVGYHDAIEKFAERLHDLCGFEIDNIQYPYLLDESRIDEIAKQMKNTTSIM